jgi:hypothetical protein
MWSAIGIVFAPLAERVVTGKRVTRKRELVPSAR